MKPNILFMGSSTFSSRILRNLNTHIPVKLIVTQPDKPVGRGNKIEPAMIKLIGEELSIPVIQPIKCSYEEIHDYLIVSKIDLIIVAAYGKILRKQILNFPEFGCINVHASLLPRWRGASPIQSAILHGDSFTGVTIIKMDEGIDTGAVLGNSSLKIEPDETSESLEEKLSILGSHLLIKTLPGYLDGSIIPQQQSNNGASYAELIKKADGLLDFSKPAELLDRQTRALFPWPICFLDWENSYLRVLKTKISNGKKLKEYQRGIQDDFPSIGTSTNDLLLFEVQPPGKKRMDGKSFLNGVKNWKN